MGAGVARVFPLPAAERGAGRSLGLGDVGTARPGAGEGLRWWVPGALIRGRSGGNERSRLISHLFQISGV